MRSTGLSKVAGIEGFIPIYFESKERSELRIEGKTRCGEDNIIPINTNITICMQIVLHCQSGSEEDERLEFKSEAVPHAGELLPPKNSIFVFSERRSRAIQKREPIWG